MKDNLIERDGKLWFVEYHSDYTGHIYAVRRVLYRGESCCQSIGVYDLYHYGKTLVLDGKIQSTACDEWVYHEVLVHPMMVTHPEPKRVLVIGGGEGATAREVLRHKTVEEVHMVDIDSLVLKVCRKYLPEFSRGAFKDPRLSIIIGDGRKFLENAKQGFYDVAVIDATDPIEGGPALLLYTKEFYELVWRCLSEDGVMVTQAVSPSYEFEDQITCTVSIFRTVGSVFPIARYYRAYIPSFDGEWGFVLGSKTHDPLDLSAEVVDERLRRRGVDGLKYYHSRLHTSLFTMPKNIKELLESFPKARVLRDDEPAFVY